MIVWWVMFRRGLLCFHWLFHHQWRWAYNKKSTEKCMTCVYTHVYPVPRDHSETPLLSKTGTIGNKDFVLEQ